MKQIVLFERVRNAAEMLISALDTDQQLAAAHSAVFDAKELLMLRREAHNQVQKADLDYNCAVDEYRDFMLASKLQDYLTDACNGDLVGAF